MKIKKRVLIFTFFVLGATHCASSDQQLDSNTRYDCTEEKMNHLKQNKRIEHVSDRGYIYPQTAQNLKSLGYNPEDKSLNLLWLESTDDFNQGFSKEELDLIDLYVNSGDPHFVIVYSCDSDVVVDVAMYADGWGVYASNFFDGRRLVYEEIYKVGPKHAGEELSEKNLMKISNDFKKALKHDFSPERVIPSEKSGL